MKNPVQKVALVILDGWGVSPETAHNAVHHAHTPTWDTLLKTAPHTTINASESHVGLPCGQMGNSEVGHMTIGAGRVFLQDLERINAFIKEKGFDNHPAFNQLINQLKQRNTTCHLLGLASPGGVHSHTSHLEALIAVLAKHSIPTYLHLFLDGRDTPPKSAAGFIKGIQSTLPKTATIATLGGRYFGMDRDNRWDRVLQAYSAIAQGEGARIEDPVAYIQECYNQNITDEFIPPAVVGPYSGISQGEGLLAFNFRADRMRQLMSAFVKNGFSKFPTPPRPSLAFCAGMTAYSDALAARMTTLFPKELPTDTLGQVIADHGLAQVRIAETEKYAHVTYFFNGGRNAAYAKEERVLIDSPNVATYDLQPQMSAPQVTQSVLDAIDCNKFALLVVNFANPDMVGHTGNFQAACQALEAVDKALASILSACKKNDVVLLITADHGNVEKMFDPSAQTAHTAHTTNLVPFVVANGPKKLALAPRGSLADIAPTLLSIMGLPIPTAMTGKSLLK